MLNGYSIFIGGKHFVDDGSQNHLIFQSVYIYFKTFTDTDKIFAWKSRDLPKLLLHHTIVYNAKIGAKCERSCSKQNGISFNPRSTVNVIFV